MITNVVVLAVPTVSTHTCVGPVGCAETLALTTLLVGTPMVIVPFVGIACVATTLPDCTTWTASPDPDNPETATVIEYPALVDELLDEELLLDDELLLDEELLDEELLPPPLDEELSVEPPPQPPNRAATSSAARIDPERIRSTPGFRYRTYRAGLFPLSLASRALQHHSNPAGVGLTMHTRFSSGMAGGHRQVR